MIFRRRTRSTARNGEARSKPSTPWFQRLDSNAWRWAGIVFLSGVAVFALIQAFRSTGENQAASQIVPQSSTSIPIAPVAAPLVTTLPSIVVPTQPPPSTTAPAATNTATTTTTNTTTTAPPTTTTVPPPFIEPAGDPIPPANLTLSVTGIGPLRLGSPAAVVLGALAASLGQPDVDSSNVPAGSHGTCLPGTFRVVQWGSLSVVTRGEDAIFDSYRVDLRLPNPSGPADELRTLSGFKAGSTIAEFETVYVPGFQITYTTQPVEGDIFELRSGQGLLLWGPVTSSQGDGIVQGLFSPDTC